ncbi:MAG: small multi-drug export protein [Candidatus Hydrothermarchaeota archaeon]|nr:small multi-drug export protein [Candidatus Hydrothermarchaeota archaeon]
MPLPVTGAWTGAAAAYIFGIKRRYSFPAIVLGVLAAGIIVTLASLGLVSFNDALH